MLEVFVNFICASMLAILGFYTIKKIIKSSRKIDTEVLLYLILNSIIITVIHCVEYKASFLLNFVTNTITYKMIFNESIEKAFIETGIMMFLIVATDIALLPLYVNITTLKEVQTNSLFYLLSNIGIILIVFLITKIKIIMNKLHQFYLILSKKDLKLNVIFILLIVIAIWAVIYSIFTNYTFNFVLISDTIIILCLILIGVVFIINRDSYNKLVNKYDILLFNVSTFEDWIEKEQFTRHEYKNQLAVLYALSSEKEVKDKIQEIINQNLNIKNEVVNNLKELPKGGLKGLLYYKTIVAEKSKLNITVDVSIKEKGILKKLNKKQITTLAKIVGILYDNAIDAAKESRKKNLLLEIYELKDRVNIVISNTFKRSSIVENRFDKGVSSKGKGHGNGLYYLSKILKENDWIEEKQEIIDNYYVETITIKKKTSKK